MRGSIKHLPNTDLWEAIPPLFPEVYGSPYDRADSYHIYIAGAVVAAIRGMP